MTTVKSSNITLFLTDATEIVTYDDSGKSIQIGSIQFLDDLQNDTHVDITSITLTFLLDLSSYPEPEPQNNANSLMYNIIERCPNLLELNLIGFQSYYFTRYRVWEASLDFFNMLELYPTKPPPLNRLSFKMCCLTNDDIKLIGPIFPNLKSLKMDCCAGFNRITVETYLMPYINEFDFDNDDSWHPNESNIKNKYFYCKQHFTDGEEYNNEGY